MRVLIVDDEEAARERLRRLVAEFGDEIAGEASDGVEALNAIGRLRPDVVLLDIRMPEVSGLDVARRLSEPRPLLIFQTAFGEYALEAFDREALDYVLKPVTRERLAQALARARARLGERAVHVRVTADMAARLEQALADQPARALGRPRRLLVRHQAGHRLVPVTDIVRFVARDGLVWAVTRDGESIVDDTLDELATRLTGLVVRTSRADLVAIDRVDRITSNGDGSATLTLRDGTQFHVTRRRASDVKQALNR